MNPVYVTKARYVRDYIVELTFNDGIEKAVDFTSIINRRMKIFSPLLDKEVFKNFSLNGWTLSWLDGQIDIAPESLYQAARS